MIQELLLHVPYVPRVRIPCPRRHAHAIPQLLRGQALRQLEQSPEHRAYVVRRHLVRAHRAVVPLAGGGIEADLGDPRPALVAVGLEAHALAVRQAQVSRHVDRGAILAHDAHPQHVVSVVGAVTVVPVSEILPGGEDLDVDRDGVEVLPLEEADVRPAHVRRVRLEDDAVREVVVGVAVPVRPDPPLLGNVRQEAVEVGPVHEVLAHEGQGDGRVRHGRRVEDVRRGPPPTSGAPGEGRRPEVAQALLERQVEYGLVRGIRQHVEDHEDRPAQAPVDDDLPVEDGAWLDRQGRGAHRIVVPPVVVDATATVGVVVLGLRLERLLRLVTRPVDEDGTRSREHQEVPDAVRLLAEEVPVPLRPLNLLDVVTGEVHGHAPDEVAGWRAAVAPPPPRVVVVPVVVRAAAVGGYGSPPALPSRVGEPTHRAALAYREPRRVIIDVLAKELGYLEDVVGGIQLLDHEPKLLGEGLGEFPRRCVVEARIEKLARHDRREFHLDLVPHPRGGCAAPAPAPAPRVAVVAIRGGNFRDVHPPGEAPVRPYVAPASLDPARRPSGGEGGRVRNGGARAIEALLRRARQPEIVRRRGQGHVHGRRLLLPLRMARPETRRRSSVPPVGEVYPRLVRVGVHGRDALRLGELRPQDRPLALVRSAGFPARERRAQRRRFRQSRLRPSQVVRSGDPPLEIRRRLLPPALRLPLFAVGNVRHERVRDPVFPPHRHDLGTRRQRAHVPRSEGGHERAQTRLDLHVGVVAVVAAAGQTQAAGRRSRLHEEDLDGVLRLGRAGEERVARGGGGRSSRSSAGGRRGRRTVGRGALRLLGGLAQEAA